MKKIGFNGNKNLISETLRATRLARGLSQGELAARLQTLGLAIDQQMLSKIEHNARIVTDYELLCLCTVLGVPVSQLLPGMDL